jgi:hypothetical protein
MAFVAEQITDAVTQANVEVVAAAPAMAMGSLFQTMNHSTGLTFENSVSNQNLQNMTAQAASTQGIMQMYSVDTISDAISVAKMLSSSSSGH